MLSPFLFTIYLNQLILELRNEGENGIFINENIGYIQTLVYADDLVCVADTVGNLQKQINIIQNYCKNWGMKVNLDKTKIVVFRNGGPCRQNEQWFYEGKEIERVSSYKYLGISLSSRLNWTHAKKILALQSQKSLYSIYKVQYKCYLSVKILLELFQKIISPILVYGAEVLGY